MTFCGNTMSQKFSTVSGLFVFPIPRHYIFILKKQITQSIKKQNQDALPDDGGDSFYPALHCRQTFEKYAIKSLLFFVYAL